MRKKSKLFLSVNYIESTSNNCFNYEYPRNDIPADIGQQTNTRSRSRYDLSLHLRFNALRFKSHQSYMYFAWRFIFMTVLVWFRVFISIACRRWITYIFSVQTAVLKGDDKNMWFQAYFMMEEKYTLGHLEMFSNNGSKKKLSHLQTPVYICQVFW